MISASTKSFQFTTVDGCISQEFFTKFLIKNTDSPEGKSTEHLSRIETGSYRPSLSLIEKVSEIFSVDEQNLMFGSTLNETKYKELYDMFECLSEDKKTAITTVLSLISD